MLTSDINEVVQTSRKVADSLRKGGLNRPSERLEKTARMLSALSTCSEDEARKKLASKPYMAELDFLHSAVTDIKGLKDICPSQLQYQDWRYELSEINEALNKLK